MGLFLFPADTMAAICLQNRFPVLDDECNELEATGAIELQDESASSPGPHHHTPSPTLFALLQLLSDLHQGHQLSLEATRALRLTSTSVRNFVDEHFPMKARCPGGEVQAFCEHKTWISTLRHVKLCALYGSNCDGADVASFCMLDMPQLHTLEVESMQWGYAFHILLERGNWPNLTSLSLHLRMDSPENFKLDCARRYTLPRAALNWPLRQLVLKFSPGRFRAPTAEVLGAAFVLMMFPGLKVAKVIGDFRREDLEKALRAAKSEGTGSGLNKLATMKDLQEVGLEVESRFLSSYWSSTILL